MAVLGPSHISVDQRQKPRGNLWSEGLQEAPDILPAGNWAVSLKLSFKAYASYSLYAQKNSICGTYTSHLLLKIIVSYIAIEAIDCFHVFRSQFKIKHLERRKNHINLSPKEPASPWDWRTPAGWGQQERKREASSHPQLDKDTPHEKYSLGAYSPTHHLYVLFDPLLVVTLGQEPQPHVVSGTEGRQELGFACAFWQWQREPGPPRKGVWVHPGRKFRNVRSYD